MNRYPKFDQLGLKWFAVPAVCNMSLDCGGQIYPATGFNGWYMSTEIVRDFCDSGRYSLLKVSWLMQLSVAELFFYFQMIRVGNNHLQMMCPNCTVTLEFNFSRLRLYV